MIRGRSTRATHDPWQAPHEQHADDPAPHAADEEGGDEDAAGGHHTVGARRHQVVHNDEHDKGPDTPFVCRDNDIVNTSTGVK